MKYFVTGGAGFIGSHLVDRLIQRGQVTVYDNLSSGKLAFVECHRENLDFHFVKADLLELPRLIEAIAGHDVVFHFAANPEARGGIKDTSLDLHIGTIATYNVLEAMRTTGIPRIVFSSSGTVYGDVPIILLPEDYGPLLPISLYGASKLACEGLLSAFCHVFGFQAWIFRFANIVGSRSTHGVIYDFINKLRRDATHLEILGDGTQEKPYLHVSECVDGLLYGFEHAKEQVNLYNLGCETSTSVNTMARMVVEEMGLRNVQIHYTGGERGWPGDVPQVRFDVRKMTALGWRAKRTSDEAVRMAIREILLER